MTTLKPCPFCRRTDVYLTDSDRHLFWVHCPCGAEGPDGDSKAEAIENWNRRPDMILVPAGEVNADRLRELMKELTEMPVTLKFITEDP